jgi:SulP family sulfate permease
MLAAIIISSVFKLINVKEMIRLFKLEKADFYAMIACFLITIIVGIQAGIFTGILLSIGFILWKTMKPHYAVLGKLSEQEVYRNIDRFSEATCNPSVLIFRYDDDLYFANSDYFYDKVLEEIENRPEIKTLIIDFSSISHIDSTGFDTLKLLSRNLSAEKIEWKISGLKGPVRDLFAKYGYLDIIAENQCYMSIDLAVESC